MTVKIDRKAPDGAEPYLNLLPMVQFLVARGNHTTRGFCCTRDGWVCHFRDRLDLESVRDSFLLPPNVRASEQYDSILDELTWCVIAGPEARRAI